MSLTEAQIKEALKSDAVKEAIQAAIDAEVTGLKSKNAELLGKLKDKDKKIDDFNERLEKIEAEKTAAEEKAAGKSGDVEKLRETLEAKHQKEIEKLTEKLTKTNAQLNTHVVGEGLTAALVKAKVAPALMDAAKALITTQFKAEVGDNDGKPFAKFDGKTVDEFVTGWAQSEAGKHFVTADNNNGGGSNGANGSGKASTGSEKKTMPRTDFDALSHVDKAAKIKEGVQLVD